VNEMNLLARFRAEVPLRISPHAEGRFDAGIYDHSAERSVVRPSRTLFAHVLCACRGASQRTDPPAPAGERPRTGPRAHRRLGGPAGYLTRPVSPAGPICVSLPAYVEYPGIWDCP
jgi:hypothetical protein